MNNTIRWDFPNNDFYYFTPKKGLQIMNNNKMRDMLERKRANLQIKLEGNRAKYITPLESELRMVDTFLAELNKHVPPAAENAGLTEQQPVEQSESITEQVAAQNSNAATATLEGGQIPTFLLNKGNSHAQTDGQPEQKETGRTTIAGGTCDTLGNNDGHA